MAKEKVAAIEFAKAWQAASSVSQLCADLNIDENYARTRASYMRRKGVQLKHMRERTDWKAIASAIDAPSLIKIAAVAHSESCPDEALSALRKALKVSAKHPQMQVFVRSGAESLGYELD